MVSCAKSTHGFGQSIKDYSQLLIGGMTCFSHQDGCPMISVIVCMDTLNMTYGES